MDKVFLLIQYVKNIAILVLPLNLHGSTGGGVGLIQAASTATRKKKCHLILESIENY